MMMCPGHCVARQACCRAHSQHCSSSSLAYQLADAGWQTEAAIRLSMVAESWKMLSVRADCDDCFQLSCCDCLCWQYGSTTLAEEPRAGHHTVMPAPLPLATQCLSALLVAQAFLCNLASKLRKKIGFAQPLFR